MKRLHRILLTGLLATATAGQTFVAAADDDPARIEAVNAVERTATPSEGGILLAADQSTVFDIFSITGQRVKSISVESGSVKVNLPKGCYIVRCPQWSKKVVVK